MQTNYQESPINGTKWRRAFHVDIRNPLDAAAKSRANHTSTRYGAIT